MAESNVKITFEIDGLEQSVTSIDDAKKALKGLEDQAKKAEKGMEDVGDAAKDVAEKSEESAKASEGFFKVVDEATGGLATKVKEVGLGLFNMGKKAVTAFKGAVAGANSMGKALIATGIGAIVVAVGLLVAYWDDIKGLVSGVSSAQKRLLEDTQATVDANQANLEATEASENSLKLAGKSEQEIRDLKIQQTNEVITATEALLEQQKAMKKSQVEAAERNQKITAGIIAFLTAPITILLGAIDALTYGLAAVGVIDKGTSLAADYLNKTSSWVFDPEEVASEGDATIAETEKQLNSLRNKRDGYLLQNKEAEKKGKEDSVNTQKELNAELERLRAENIADAEAKALKLLEIEYNRSMEELKAKGASQELLLELEKKYEADKAAIVADYAKQRQDAQDALDAKYLENRQAVNDILAQLNLDAIDDQFRRAEAELEAQRQKDRQILIDKEATTAELAKFDQAYVDKAKALAKEEADYKKELKEQEIDAALNATSAVLGSIVDLVGEGSAVGKAAALAQNAIDTYTSATAAYKSTVGIPVVGPVLAPIAAGVAVAAGLKNAKAIMSVKTPGNKSVAAPAINTPSAAAVDPNAALASAAGGQDVTNQLTLGQQQGSTGATVVKAYVVSSEMTSQQEADKKINDLARL